MTTLADVEDVFTMYSSLSYIDNRLKNYSFVRFDLKILITVSASPYISGMIRSFYDHRSSNLATDCMVPATTDFEPGASLGSKAYSKMYLFNKPGHTIQLPHETNVEFTITPITIRYSSSGTPYSYTDGGRLHIFPVVPFTNTQDTSSPAYANVSIFASAENVQLWGLKPQSKRIQGKGLISAPASAVAQVASALKPVPFLGKFATAVELGAEAVSGIAHLFGFSRPADLNSINAISSIHQNNISAIDSCLIRSNREDPSKQMKQNISDITGLPGDPLDPANTIFLESLIYSGSLLSSDVTLSEKFQIPITPCVYSYDSSNLGLVPSNLGFFSMPFAYWRGTLVYRIRFLTTAVTRGKVRFWWSYDGAASTSTTNANSYNVVVDLSEQSNIEIEVPFMANADYLRVLPINNTFTFAGSVTYKTYDWTNGFLHMDVIEPIFANTGAGLSLPFTVEFFAGHDFQVSSPTSNSWSRLLQCLTVPSVAGTLPTTSVSWFDGIEPSLTAPTNYLTYQSKRIRLGVDTSHDKLEMYTSQPSFPSLKTWLKKPMPAVLRAYSGLSIADIHFTAEPLIPATPGHTEYNEESFSDVANWCLLSWYQTGYLGFIGAVRISAEELRSTEGTSAQGGKFYFSSQTHLTPYAQFTTRALHLGLRSHALFGSFQVDSVDSVNPIYDVSSKTVDRFIHWRNPIKYATYFKDTLYQATPQNPSAFPTALIGYQTGGIDANGEGGHLLYYSAGEDFNYVCYCGPPLFLVGVVPE